MTEKEYQICASCGEPCVNKDGECIYCGANQLLIPKKLKRNGMEEVTIYKFQLETIVEALRLTSNYNESEKGDTCYNRQVRQAYKYAQNALDGKKDIIVKYIGK